MRLHPGASKLKTQPTRLTQSQQTLDQIQDKVQLWHDKIPFSGFSVFKDDDFVGQVELTETAQPGEAAIGYAFAKAAQGKGIGTRSVKP